MSRARRRPRHRRPPRLARTAAPVVLGGALAAAAVSATPLGDALRSPGQERRAAGGPDRPATGVLYLAPSGNGTPGGALAGEAGSDGNGGAPPGSGDRRGQEGKAADGAAVRPVAAERAPAPAAGTPGPAAPSAPAPGGPPAPAPTPPGTPPPDPVLPVPLPAPTPTATPLPPLLPTLPAPLPTLPPLLP